MSVVVSVPGPDARSDTLLATAPSRLAWAGLVIGLRYLPVVFTCLPVTPGRPRMAEPGTWDRRNMLAMFFIQSSPSSPPMTFMAPVKSSGEYPARRPPMYAPVAMVPAFERRPLPISMSELLALFPRLPMTPDIPPFFAASLSVTAALFASFSATPESAAASTTSR